jgi:hypothetical protein
MWALLESHYLQSLRKNHCHNLDNAVSSLINRFFRYIMLKFKALLLKRSVSASIFGLSKMNLMTADDRLTLLDTISLKLKRYLWKYTVAVLRPLAHENARSLGCGKKTWTGRELNPRPLPCQGSDLPLIYRPIDGLFRL